MKAIVQNFILGGVLTFGGSGWLGAAEPAGAAVPPDLLLQCHFSGLDQLLANPDAAKLKVMWSLPATRDLKNQFLDQLARVPFQTLSNQLARGTPNGTSLIRPLLEDLLPGESFLGWRGPAGQPTEFVLALQLSDVRARLWSTNLWQTLQGWKLGALASVRTDAGDGWVCRLREGASALAFTRAGQWVVLGWGPAALPQHGQVVSRIKAEGRPGPKSVGHWLVADVNLDRLKPWLPPLQSYAHPPVARVAVSNQADYVRTSVRLQFPEGHGWQHESWKIPKGFMRDPIISFTAIQGLAPLLKSLKTFQQLGLNPTPNQAFVWANGSFALQTQIAFLSTNTGPQITHLGSVLPTVVFADRTVTQAGGIGWDTNHHALVWRSLPLATPQIAALKAKDGSGEYFVGNLFPSAGGTNRPPPELFAQVENRNDLVYYDWELTEQRLRQWRPIYQLLDMVTDRAFVRTNAPSQRWLLTMAPLLGNTVTEIAATSPTELTLVRKSHCGFTGFELVSLARWLDSPKFPTLNLLGQPKLVKPPRQAKPKSK